MDGTKISSANYIEQMSNFPAKICRACENSSHLVNISLPKKKNVVNQLLACASVTVYIPYITLYNSAETFD